MNRHNLLLILYLFVPSLSLLAQPQYNTLADMTNTIRTATLRNAMTLRILGYQAPGDWGTPKDYRWDPTNVLAVNRYRVPGDGATGRFVFDISELLTSWVLAESFRITTLNYSSGIIITNAAIVWPDGGTGLLSVVSWNLDWDTPDAFTLSHEHSGYTVFQTNVLRDANGIVTNRPALIFQ